MEVGSGLGARVAWKLGVERVVEQCGGETKDRKARTERGSMPRGEGKGQAAGTLHRPSVNVLNRFWSEREAEDYPKDP